MEKRFAPETPRFEMRKTARDLTTRATLTLKQIPLGPRLGDERKDRYTLEMVKGGLTVSIQKGGSSKSSIFLDSKAVIQKKIKT